jgi:hypothetical protein
MRRVEYKYPGWARDRRKSIRLVADCHGLSDEYASLVIDMLEAIITEELVIGEATTRRKIKEAVNRALARVSDLDEYVKAEWEKRYGR